MQVFVRKENSESGVQLRYSAPSNDSAVFSGVIAFGGGISSSFSCRKSCRLGSCTFFFFSF